VAGRRRERQTVADVLRGDLGLAGLLLVGEAGIGKSLLVEVVADDVAEKVAVSTGWCMPADGLPLLPIIDVLRTLSERDGDGLLESLAAECPGFVREEMARLLPEQSGPPSRPADIEPEAGRRRMFDAIRRILTVWGARQHAAVIIEDVHWADRETCELLDYLLSPGRKTGVPMVMTCRAEQLVTAEFAAWLERWQRLDGVRRVDLAALTAEDTAGQIASLLDRPIPRRFATDTFKRSEGNPFFTEQLVAWAAAADFGPAALTGLPPGLTSLLLSRTRQLSGSAREILSVLSVAARPLTEPDIAMLTGLPAVKTRRSLSKLQRLNLLRPPRGDGVELRHVLLAEAVAADLLPAERRDVHARVADLFIARNDAGDAADICGHLAAAGRTADELRWRVLAASEAERIFALTAAAQHWQRVIALWDDIADAESITGMSYFDAYVKTREALSDSGDGAAAGALTEAVFRRLGSSVTGELAVRMYRLLGHHRELDLPNAAQTAYATAIEIGDRLPPSRDYIFALHEYAQLSQVQGDYSATDGLFERALMAGRAGGFRDLEQQSLAAHAESLVDRGLFEPARARIEQSMNVALDNAPHVRWATWNALAYDYVFASMNELRRAIASTLPAIRNAERAGLGDYLTVQMLRANVVEAWTELGDVTTAAEFLDPLTTGQPARDTAFIYLQRAYLDFLRGRLADAEAFWLRDADVPWGYSLNQRWELSWRRAEFELWRRQPAQALAAVGPLLEDMLDTDMARMTARLFALAARAYADLGQTDLQHTGPSASELDRLIDLAARAKLDPFAGPMPVTAQADGLLTRAEATRATGRPAPDIWDQAAASFDALERPHRAGYARWRQAEALLASGGHQTQAAEILRKAATSAAQHMPLTQAIHDLAQRARITLSTTDAPSSAASEASEVATPFGLTDREMAVLRLVGHGKTNSEIGATLYISRKTASVHVSNIMRKLQAGSRVQAATIAERAGLLTSPNNTGAHEIEGHTGRQ
jgi:DNA-binding CsgD family transcriptional regulator